MLPRTGYRPITYVASFPGDKGMHGANAKTPLRRYLAGLFAEPGPGSVGERTATRGEVGGSVCGFSWTTRATVIFYKPWLGLGETTASRV